MEQQQQLDNLQVIVEKPVTKTEVSNMVEKFVVDVLEDGGTTLLSKAEIISGMEEFIKTLRKNEDYIHAVRQKLKDEGGKYTTASGTVLEICEAGTTYDYSQNPDWVLLQGEIETLKTQQKEIEEKMRKIPPGKSYVDVDTGEVMTGALKKSTSTYKVTLKK